MAKISAHGTEIGGSVMTETTEYVRCDRCNELKIQDSYSCTACETPAYNLDSAALKKYRRMASKDEPNLIKSMDRYYRQAYGQAVEDAVLAKQRSMLKCHGEVMPAASCASGTWHATGDAIDKAIKAQHRAALQAYPGQVRRARTPQEWKKMYDETMKNKNVYPWNVD